MTGIELNAFAVGAVIGIIISILLSVRPVAIFVACCAVILPLILFYQGGHELIISEVQRMAKLSIAGQSSGFISGVLIGKLLSAVGRGLNGGQR